MPGKPAARVGDSTAHGGTISPPGVPMVLIGGMPAATVSDMHICPMVTPGTPPIPHVGGNIVTTAASVLIGGKPPARVGDTTICTGPPGTIVVGCFTVLIGDGGGGGGGGSSGSGETEGTSAAVELDELHYLNVKFVDKGGKPIQGVDYILKAPDGSTTRAPLSGEIKKSGIAEGDYEIQLKAITKAEWSAKKARDGEVVKMLVETGGIEDGTKATFDVWQKDSNRADEKIGGVSGIEVSGGKVEGEWTYEYPEDDEDDDPEVKDDQPGYSSPKFYFTVTVDRQVGRSGLLDYKDWIEIDLKDDDGDAIGEEEYILYLPNGEARKGKLDDKGHAKEEKVPPGKCTIKFPEYEKPSDE